MPPKAKTSRLAKGRQALHNCENVKGERFHAQIDDIFRYNWWEVFCFPYILCARVWECCVTLCAGTNHCLIYWMVIQWLVCKLTKITTPDPIIFPYFFYVFCQVIVLTVGFIILWNLFGRTILIPYFVSFWTAFSEGPAPETPKKNTTKLSFRRYCFRKSEIFDTKDDNNYGDFLTPDYTLNVFVIIVDLFLYQALN